MAESRWLNLELCDSSGAPLAGRPYTIAFGEDAAEPGELDGRGRVSLAVPEGAERASLTVAHRRLDLLLAGLPGADSVEGAQERLNHLNYFVGKVDGEFGPFTAGALRRFQHHCGLAESGELDADTAARLRREHGA